MDRLQKDSLDGVDIIVSPDRMSVSLTIRQGAKAPAADVIEQLRRLKIARFDDGLVIEAIEESKTGVQSIEVALGVNPVDDQPEQIDFAVPFSLESTSESIKVEAGQVVASITPPVAGTDGSDVFGRPIERQKKTALQIGRNLTTKQGKVTCQARGNLRLIQNALSVEPLLELQGDLDDAAPIVFDGDASIRGTIKEGRNVQITGCLNVSGSMEAIQLNTGGSVIVHGGIIGKQSGRYTIGGDLRCEFVSGGFIVASRDIHVQSDISDARIACAGRLEVAQGLIFGGAVAANSGLSCATLGHPGGLPTLIEAGEGIASRSILATAGMRITANKQRIETIRAKITPLLEILKSLTAQQREKATELLYEADELDAVTEKLIADLNTKTGDLIQKSRAEVVVSKMVHPGVTVRFPTAKTMFTKMTRGPFKLVPYRSGENTTIMLIDGNDRSATELPTTRIEAGKPVQAAFQAAA